MGLGHVMFRTNRGQVGGGCGIEGNRNVTEVDCVDELALQSWKSHGVCGKNDGGWTD